MKGIFCCTFHITSKTKLMFILKTTPHFPLSRGSAEFRINRLKDSSLFYHVVGLECILKLLLLKQIIWVTILILQQYYPVFLYDHLSFFTN